MTASSSDAYDVPIVDLSPWRHGDLAARQEVASAVDKALRNVGFLILSGHGVDAALAARVRDQVARFFALPEPVKDRYRTRVGGQGWIPPGAEANSYARNVAGPPDLKETFNARHDYTEGLDVYRGGAGNRWPTEVPALQEVVTSYLDAVRALARDLLGALAVGLGVPAGTFLDRAHRPPSVLNINHYPPMSATGPPESGQFRVGAHTDFGLITILDRQPGYGGLQIERFDGTWVDAPWFADTLTVNVGDLLARWTGDRWRSTSHRVLPPSPDAPDEALTSLVYFFNLDRTTLVRTLAVGGPTHYDPVVADDYLAAKVNAIDVV